MFFIGGTKVDLKSAECWVKSWREYVEGLVIYKALEMYFLMGCGNQLIKSHFIYIVDYSICSDLGTPNWNGKVAQWQVHDYLFVFLWVSLSLQRGVSIAVLCAGLTCAFGGEELVGAVGTVVHPVTDEVPCYAERAVGTPEVLAGVFCNRKYMTS